MPSPATWDEIETKIRCITANSDQAIALLDKVCAHPFRLFRNRRLIGEVRYLLEEENPRLIRSLTRPRWFLREPADVEILRHLLNMQDGIEETARHCSRSFRKLTRKCR